MVPYEFWRKVRVRGDIQCIQPVLKGERKGSRAAGVKGVGVGGLGVHLWEVEGRGS